MLIRTTLMIAAIAVGGACKRDRDHERKEPTTTGAKPTEATRPVEPKPGKRLDGEALATHYKDCTTFINTGQLDQFKKACTAPTIVAHHMDGRDIRGADAIAGMFKSLQGSFSDLKLSPQLVAISGRNILAVQLMSGTHDRDLAVPGEHSLPKTGKKLGVLFFHRLAIDDQNKATEEWTYSDPLTMLGQLGQLPKQAPKPRALAQSWPGAPITVVTGDSPTERTNLEQFGKMMAAFNAHDVNAVGAYFADDAIESDQATGMDQKGRAAIAEMTKEFIQAFPDVKAEITHVYAAGDYVIAEARITGKHTGTAGKLKATNKTIAGHFVEVAKFQDGKIVELYRFRNGMAMAQQLGQIQQKPPGAQPKQPQVPPPPREAP